MKIVRILFFILLTTLIYSTRVHAQVNLFNIKDLRFVNIDDYSDDELASMLKKATESELSTSQLLQLVADRGLPDIEIVKLKNRLQFISKVSQPDESDQAEIADEDNVLHENDTTASNIPLQKFQNDQSIFLPCIN